MCVPYKSDELEQYETAISERAKEFFCAAKKIQAENKQKWFQQCLSVVNEYCVDIYNLAEIEMDETDIEYFYTFELLRNFCKNPKLDDLFGPYKEYIFNNN